MDTQPASVDFLQTLSNEFAIFGIEVPTHDFTNSRLAASIERDEFGFVLTGSPSAFQTVEAFLAPTFGQPVFCNAGTRIYRNDSCFTTTMLINDDSNTKVIVLYWKNQDVHSKIAEAQMSAIGAIVEGAVSEVERLGNEVDKGEKSMEQLLTAVNELQELETVLQSPYEKTKYSSVTSAPLRTLLIATTLIVVVMGAIVWAVR